MAECALIYPPFSIGAPFHGYLTVPEDFEHIEPKSSVKSVAADQIICACQNYWGASPHAMALFEATSSYTKRNRRRTKVTPWNGAGILPHRMTRTN